MSYDTLTLVGRHVPDENSGPFDSMQEAQAAGYDVLNPVTGFYEIGALIDGQFVTILSEKASLIFDQVQAAKAAASSTPPAAADQSAESQSGSAMQTGEQATQTADPEQGQAVEQPQG